MSNRTLTMKEYHSTGQIPGSLENPRKKNKVLSKKLGKKKEKVIIPDLEYTNIKNGNLTTGIPHNVNLKWNAKKIKKGPRGGKFYKSINGSKVYIRPTDFEANQWLRKPDELRISANKKDILKGKLNTLKRYKKRVKDDRYNEKIELLKKKLQNSKD